MAVVNFKSAMPNVGGSSATPASSGSGSKTMRNILILLAVAGIGYYAYNQWQKRKKTAENDDN